MPTSVRWLAATALTSAVLAASPGYAQSVPPGAASPAPSASPSPQASAPSGPSDPCTSILATVNRPTVTTGSCVFKNGHGDVEIGYADTVTDGTGGGVAVAYPQTFLRSGTALRNVEFEITPPSVVRSSAGGATVSGIADAAFGAKWEIGYTSKAIASVNVLATVPTGDRAFSAGGSVYTANLNAGYALNSVFGLSATLGFSSLAAPAPNFAVLRTGAFNPSVLLTAALPGSSQLYAEAAGTSHAGVGLGGRTLYDFGVQKQFGGRIVVDIEGGFAPTPVSGQKTHFLGLGVTYGVP